MSLDDIVTFVTISQYIVCTVYTGIWLKGPLSVVNWGYRDDNVLLVSSECSTCSFVYCVRRICTAGTYSTFEWNCH